MLITGLCIAVVLGDETLVMMNPDIFTDGLQWNWLWAMSEFNYELQANWYLMMRDNSCDDDSNWPCTRDVICAGCYSIYCRELAWSIIFNATTVGFVM